MLTIAIVLFALAAILGLMMATKAVREQTPPMMLAIMHGLFAASGLVLLIMGVMNVASAGVGLWSLIIFIVAALGGFLLFSFHLRGKSLPIPLIIVHGLAAVIAFGLLLMWVLGTQ